MRAGALALLVCLAVAAILAAHEGMTRPVVRGRVVSGRELIGGAVVRAQTLPHSTTTARDGRFALTLPADHQGSIALTAWAPGYFCGGPVKAGGPDESVQIALRPIPREDNALYRWLPGSSAEETPGGTGCAACHSRPNAQSPRLPTDEWRLDAHSRSAVNPLFLSLYSGTDATGRRGQPTRWRENRDYGRFPLPPDRTQPYYGPGYRLDFPDTFGECGACHVPAAAIDREEGVDVTRVGRVEREGINCDFCHKIAAVRLDPATGLPYPRRPGVGSLQFHRPGKGRQYFAGPLDDVAPGDDTYLPLMRKSEICAPCHFGVFWGTVVYNSFGEWLASPYANPRFAGARTCQDCHMPRGSKDHFVLLEKGGRTRDPATLATHLMPGITDRSLMKDALTLSVKATRSADSIIADVRVTNERAGHHVPTDSPMRHVMLLVTAADEGGQALPLMKGPLLPAWAAEFGGRPGRVYAKVLEDLWTKISPAATYWNPTRIVSDTRIAAFASDATSYRFRASSGRLAVVEARLIFRRALPDLAALKKWEMTDVEMSRTRVAVLPSESGPTRKRR